MWVYTARVCHGTTKELIQTFDLFIRLYNEPAIDFNVAAIAP